MKGAISIMKRFISSVLAGVMMFSLVTPVAAQTNDQQRFMTSLNATYRQLERENAFVNSHIEVQYELLDTLAHSAYETVVEMSADFMGQTMGLNATSRVGLNNGGLSSITELFGLSDLLFVPDLSISFYMNNDIIAVGSDLIGDNYFYVERNITEAEFAASEIAQIISYNELMFLLTALQSAVDVPSLADMQLVPPEGLFDKYAEVFNSHLANARFFSEGEQRVVAERGHIIADKVTARMGTLLVSSLLSDLADTLEADTELHDYIASFLQDELQIFIAMGISAIADGLRQAADEFNGSVDFSLYIASNGLAVRQALEIDFRDGSGITLELIVDLLGREFLIDEMGFYLIVNEGGSQVAEMSLTSIGNNIMRGGVTESTTIFNFVAEDTHIEVIMDYWWDSNLTADNFTMDFFITITDPWTGMFDFAIDTKGTFYVSAEELILELTATSPMSLLLLGDADASARFFTAMRAISSDTAGIAGVGINLADITLDNPVVEQFFQLLDQM